MSQKITSFVAIFNPGLAQGRVILTLQSGSKIDLKPLQQETYTAILLTLKHDTVHWHPKGYLTTDDETPID